MITMALLLNIHRRSDGTVLLAVCDKEIQGKVFREGNKKLDLSGKFYQGEPTDRESLKKLFPVATHLNMVGRESVDFGIHVGFIQKEHVISIDSIPYAECVIVRDD